MPEPVIRPLPAEHAATRLDELAALLADAVAHGASVNFMAGVSAADTLAFWRNQLPGLAAKDRGLLAAEQADRLLGTVLVFFATQPNGLHRAEIGKMLVHSSARRLGLGRRLLGAAEQTARAAGRTLLQLDTETGSAGDLLYRSCGWTPLATVPNHAYRPNGELADTTLFLKVLGPHRPPG